MLFVKPRKKSPPSWQQELRESYTSIADLVQAKLISETEAQQLPASLAAQYPIRISRYYARLLQPHAHCPIRRQIIPAPEELSQPSLPAWAQAWCQKAWQKNQPWDADPIGDTTFQVCPRLTHRYRYRALLHTSATCGVYCRFCFRKMHLSPFDQSLYQGNFQPALDYLQAHPEIHEVILTGGDPLMLTDAALARLLTALSTIAHIQHIRIHTRMVVGLPSRISSDLCRLLKTYAPSLSMVHHFNHPRELTPQAQRALYRLLQAQIALYNQTVLMRGVNDHPKILFLLWQKLYHQGVKPYYLHHMDYVPGSFHLRVPISRGKRIMRQLVGHLSGPALPEYVLDLPGGGGKIHLMHGPAALERRFEANLHAEWYRFRKSHTRACSANPYTYYADFAPVSATLAS
jgi:lysine 2,3-aminomutase